MSKITVVAFIIVVGLANFDAGCISPFEPDQRVVAVHGEDAVAFGWPWVVGTILGTATLSIMATFALVGMQKYTEIDAEEAYGNAFSSVGMDWAVSFVASGEVLTMPITLFIGFMAQPCVQYAMARDGLLPTAFAEVDSKGNLFRGTLLCGVLSRCLCPSTCCGTSSRSASLWPST
ncbi:hypothetical protein PR003_g29195 [Phytophthora rubi]|uniref:Amino acid permease/ SLC12A domain-containing protein n=1 Tax=Phytophthora rubi TaxID=129364 RepID=A0A6A3HF25_9STRA|nr:hypothetical protein PR002_g28083 [Phytophthora rubi]KAE8967659.1 hypothetical protein PR001_g28034 [Phytophthora rubi]KAE9275935.1 hypothetical protein PR003_g29195 [Phytophthora rubi]